MAETTGAPKAVTQETLPPAAPRTERQYPGGLNLGAIALYGIGALVAYKLLAPVPAAGQPSAPGLVDRVKQLLGLTPGHPAAVRRPPSASVPVGPPPAVTAPVPSVGGITFRSGNVAGFIPIPFQDIASGIFSGIASIFQPSRDQTRINTAPADTAEPLPEQPLASQNPNGEVINPDGTVHTAADQGQAGQQFYQSGASEGAQAVGETAIKESASQSGASYISSPSDYSLSQYGEQVSGGGNGGGGPTPGETASGQNVIDIAATGYSSGE